MNDYLPTQPGTQVRLDVELPRRTSRALWRHITRHAILRRQPGWGCAYCGLPPSIPASDLLQLAAQPAATRAGAAELANPATAWEVAYCLDDWGESQIVRAESEPEAAWLAALELADRGFSDRIGFVAVYPARVSCACGDPALFGFHSARECKEWPEGPGQPGYRWTAPPG